MIRRQENSVLGGGPIRLFWFCGCKSVRYTLCCFCMPSSCVKMLMVCLELVCMDQSVCLLELLMCLVKQKLMLNSHNLWLFKVSGFKSCLDVSIMNHNQTRHWNVLC